MTFVSNDKVVNNFNIFFLLGMGPKNDFLHSHQILLFSKHFYLFLLFFLPFSLGLIQEYAFNLKAQNLSMYGIAYCFKIEKISQRKIDLVLSWFEAKSTILRKIQYTMFLYQTIFLTI